MAELRAQQTIVSQAWLGHNTPISGMMPPPYPNMMGPILGTEIAVVIKLYFTI